MPDMHLLTRSSDRYAGWKMLSDFRPFQNVPCFAVSLRELPRLLQIFPLAFLRVKSSEPAELVALTALRGGRNLFVAPDGRWLAAYQPLSLRLHPFHMQAVAEEGRYSIAIRRDTGCYVESPNLTKGEFQFYGDDGEPSAAMHGVIHGLQEAHAGMLQTRRAVAVLEKFQLLERWSGESSVADEHGAEILRINETALNNLESAVLKELQESNALALAYAQIFSGARMEILHRLAAQGAQSTKAAPSPTLAPLQTSAPSLVEQVLGQGGTIRFGNT